MLDAIYDIVCNEDALGIMLARLTERFACVSAALVYIDLGRPSASVEIGHGLFTPAAIARYHAEFAAIDPAPAALAKLRIGEATATDRLFSETERATSRFLKEFYHPLGLAEAMGAPIAAKGGRFGVVGLHRNDARPPFTDTEIADFASLAEHIARAADLRRRFFALEQDVDAREVALDAVPTGIMLFDASGRLDHANAKARAILSRGDGLVLTRGGRLAARNRAAHARLTAALAPSARGVGPALIMVPREDGSPGYALKVAAQHGAKSVPDGWLVHVSDMRPLNADIPLALASALGLSARSAKLVASLVRGESLKTHAENTGVSVETARFHLKAAFRATGTARQADLVQLAVTLLRDLDL